MTRPRLFLAIALPAGLLLLASTVPFGGPDESSHFLRACQLSEGILRPPVVDGRMVGLFPAPYSRLVESFPAPPARPGWDDRALAALGDRGSDGPGDGTRHPIAIPTGAYSPVPYLPYLPALLAGRLGGASPAALLILARLSGLLVLTLLHALALKLAPSFRTTLALLALAPMPLFLRAVVSADGATIALSHLVFALALRRAASPGPSRAEDAGLVAAAALLGLCKTVYAPLALLPVCLPGARSRLPALAALAAALASAGLWTLATLGLPPVRPPDRPVDPAAQVRSLAEHPLAVAGDLVLSTARRAPTHAREAIGQLGWLDVRLPVALLFAWALALASSPLLDGTGTVRLGAARRAALLGVLLPPALLVLASQYVLWTTPGTPLAGIAGRYFLPLLPPLLLAFAPGQPLIRADERTIERGAAALSLVSAAVSAAALSGLVRF